LGNIFSLVKLLSRPTSAARVSSAAFPRSVQLAQQLLDVVNHEHRLNSSVSSVKIRKSVGNARDRNAGVSPAGSACVPAAAVLGKMLGAGG
jgi:hypothetical protein